MIQLRVHFVDGHAAGQTVEDGEDLGEPAPVVGVQSGVDIDTEVVVHQFGGKELLGVEG